MPYIIVSIAVILLYLAISPKKSKFINEKEYNKYGYGISILCVTLMILSSLIFNDGYKRGQIDAIKGKYQYRYVVITTFVGSAITSKDTIYVRKKPNATYTYQGITTKLN